MFEKDDPQVWQICVLPLYRNRKLTVRFAFPSLLTSNAIWFRRTPGSSSDPTKLLIHYLLRSIRSIKNGGRKPIRLTYRVICTNGPIQILFIRHKLIAKLTSKAMGMWKGGEIRHTLFCPWYSAGHDLHVGFMLRQITPPIGHQGEREREMSYYSFLTL